MSGLVQSVAYRRLPMMLAYSDCLTPSPVFLKSFTLGSYGVLAGLQSKYLYFFKIFST
ncbi:unnamed protein product [Lupinus luteus]|uniref:Uncharacterized protein n=1 Tax=Lupinus luteus TaxID=3873 RepID=A0AAV1YIH2_LUPLU